nr:hypothetical protein [Paracoccus luteus]
MVISEAGPHLCLELECSQLLAGFPDPDRFDLFAHEVVGFSHLLHRCRLLSVALVTQQQAPDVSLSGFRDSPKRSLPPDYR